MYLPAGEFVVGANRCTQQKGGSNVAAMDQEQVAPAVTAS